MKYLILVFILSSFVAFSQQVAPNDALMEATSADDVLGMEKALANGADINTKTAGGYTPLILAAFLGHVKAVRFLIAKKADLNKKGVDGETALIFAAGIHQEIVSELIKAGADVNIKDSDGRTALMDTIDPGMRKQLKDAGAKEIKWVNPRAHISTPRPSPSAAPSSPQASPS